ncbi:TetR/AcrR family transcriptional regulator [Streptomyces sp. bgisy029]|uniref:TetR/AcrR family transcriptional regulator n=1 Tax=Streptomyces sp. bgisy029 TaxID=3413771 RepID=UPI003D743689
MPTARDALLDAALRALADRPWRMVRMADVAALAGVSRQTLYNEFSTKAGLATALLCQAADRYLTGVDRALTAPAPAHPVAVARWTVRAARADPLVKGLLTGLWVEGLPRPGHELPGHEVPDPARLLALARDRMVAASHAPASPSAVAERCETALRLALSHVIAPRRPVPAQCAEPDSWSPITPMITSEIDTSFSVETTSPRKTMP